MRFLITGATGKVGNAVARRLAGREDEVVALVRDPAKARELLPPGVGLVRGDVTDPDSVRKAVEGADGVFNCMGLFEQWFADPGIFERVNAEGARNVVAAAREAGAKRLVHTSTFDVFHAETGGTVSESAVADYPKGTAYERSKQRAEELVIEQAEQGIELVIANPASVYGPGPWQGAGLDRAIRDAIRRRLPAVPPGGMTLVHVDDVAAGHLAAFDRGTPGERYLLDRRLRADARAALRGGRGGRARLGSAHSPGTAREGDGDHGRSRLEADPPATAAGRRPAPLPALAGACRQLQGAGRARRRVHALAGGHPQHGALDDRGGQGLSYETLQYELIERVAVLTLDRPEQRNAVSRQMNSELHDAWRRFRDDDDAFVLVLTGAGSSFCAGWDLADAAEWPIPSGTSFAAASMSRLGHAATRARSTCSSQ